MEFTNGLINAHFVDVIRLRFPRLERPSRRLGLCREYFLFLAWPCLRRAWSRLDQKGLHVGQPSFNSLGCLLKGQWIAVWVRRHSRLSILGDLSQDLPVCPICVGLNKFGERGEFLTSPNFRVGKTLNILLCAKGDAVEISNRLLLTLSICKLSLQLGNLGVT